MSKEKIVSAIDIGSSKVSVVVCNLVRHQTSSQTVPSVIGVSSVPSLGVKKGQVVDIEEAVQSVSNAVDMAEKMAGLSLASAHISVGGAHVGSLSSKGVVAVAQPEAEITQTDLKRVLEAARAVSLPSNREILHVLPRDFCVDGQSGIKDPSGMTGVRLEVETEIITGASTAIHNLVKCVSEVGIDVDGVVFSGLASGEAVLTETEKELGVVLLDIGAGTTDVAIYVEGALSYCSTLPVGAKNVTMDLAAGLRVSLESAEKIKLLLSQKEKNVVIPVDFDLVKKTNKPNGSIKSDDEIDLSKLNLQEELRKISRKTVIEGIIKYRLRELFALVKEEINKSGFMGMTPSGVVMTGGGALTVSIVESARTYLGLVARVGAPTGLSGLVDELRGPEFATVSGLIKHQQKPLRDEGTSIGFALPKISGKMQIGSLGKKIVGIIKGFIP